MMPALIHGALVLAAGGWLGAPRQADVTEELWIRAAARQLVIDSSAQLATPTQARGWRAQLALLEAYARAGTWAPAHLVPWNENDRVEVAAAKLRVLPWALAESQGFEERLARGLRSRFGAERSSALYRAAHWSLEVSALDGRASRLFARELAGGELADAVVEPLFRLALKCGDGRRFESLLTLPVAAQELEGADRGGWDPVLGFFEDIVEMPLSREELASLEMASGQAGALACVQWVARVRDRLQVELPAVDLIVPVVTGHGKVLDEGELNAVVESLVDALTVGGGASAAAQSLGKALLNEAVRPALEPGSRERCLRSAARLLPVVDVLRWSVDLGEEAALEVWDTLDRRDDWANSPELAEVLTPWIAHPSIDVREAAVRAVGRRYAYAGRLDLEGTLLRALRDMDPTLRSLSFAWLAKSGGAPDLDAELFAAWKREGHGGESPTLTPRQGRWLAQLPRDRRAVHFRGALLDLLSLEGHNGEAVGAGSLELLAGFRGDAEVFQRVAILLERSLVGIEAMAGYQDRLPFDGSAARAVRILHRVDPVGAEPLIEGALRRSMDPMHGSQAHGNARPQLPKTSVALLARTERGRARIASLLLRELPRRVRFEVALQLLRRRLPDAVDLGPAQCVDVLTGDFKGVDGALRLRAIEALGAPAVRSVERIDGFLMGLTGGGGDEAERSKAIEALGRRGNLGGLVAVLDAAIDGVGPDAGTIDAAANAARALRLSNGLPAARIALAELAGPGLAMPEERQLETVRGALLESLCDMHMKHYGAAAPGGSSWLSEVEVGSLLDAILFGPLEAARKDGPQQFRSGRRIESQFLWASELAALKTLGGDATLLRLAIGGAERWGRLDGRTLLALAGVADSAGVEDLALDLATASAVALAGEGAAPDLQRRLAEARWMNPHFDRSLLGAYRQGLLPRGVLRAMVPSQRRPEVVLHQRYWRALDEAAPVPAVARRIEAWSILD